MGRAPRRHGGNRSAQLNVSEHWWHPGSLGIVDAPLRCRVAACWTQWFFARGMRRASLSANVRPKGLPKDR
jgi:hypothetical protein